MADTVTLLSSQILWVGDSKMAQEEGKFVSASHWSFSQEDSTAGGGLVTADKGDLKIHSPTGMAHGLQELEDRRGHVIYSPLKLGFLTAWLPSWHSSCHN